MHTRLVLALVGTAFLSPVASSQTTRPTTQPAPSPAVSRELHSGAVQFRALPAVLDARERRQDWHEAAQQAEAKIKNQPLRDQLTERLSGLMPQVVDQLRSHPQDEAVVTIAVYREPAKPSEDAMILVTFNGLASQVGDTFMQDVMNNLATLPQADDIPKNLALDSEATSYLVFFFGNRKLEAGDVSQTQMNHSITVAAKQSQNNRLEQERRMAAAMNARQQQAQAQQLQQQQAAEDQAQQAAAAQAGANDVGGYPNYPSVNDGYYYPGLGVPIVILPNEYPDGTRWRQAQRRREQQLEQRYSQIQQQRPLGNTASTPSAPARPQPTPPRKAGSEGARSNSGNSNGAAAPNGRR